MKTQDRMTLDKLSFMVLIHFFYLICVRWTKDYFGILDILSLGQKLWYDLFRDTNFSFCHVPCL